MFFDTNVSNINNVNINNRNVSNITNIDDVNIDYIKKLKNPNYVIDKYPLTDTLKNNIIKYRNTIQNIINKKDKRLLIIIGPCSIHDINVAKEYATKLKLLSNKYSEKLFIVMRVYFEKPRTICDWKGFINDPDLNNSFNINKGLLLSRKLLLYITQLELPIACEFLDTITPQYYSDLVSYGAIGARTTESQNHRQLASGLSMPIGFKNSTSGDKLIAVQSVLSSQHKHCFLGINKFGYACIIKTKGNFNTHVILRGGKNGPNYQKEHIIEIQNLLNKNNLINSIIIDCSHANSNKNYKKQQNVIYSIIQQRKDPLHNIVGIMIESNLYEGKQKISDNIKYGVSITDSCIGFEKTIELIKLLYNEENNNFIKSNF
jgi:3-deoxy-7-phosphoheptulonate synthase